MQPWNITTPEQVVFRRHAAGMASRAAAFALDQAIILAMYLAVAIALGRFMAFGEFAEGLVMAAVFITYFLLNFGYSAWFEWFHQGRTPGKKALGLRVISTHGGRLRPEECLLRAFARAVDVPMPFFPPIALVVMACDPWHRRLGDLLAGTLVVHDAMPAAPAGLGVAAKRHNSYAQDPAVKARILARATRGERDLLCELLDRRDALDPVARDRIFAEAFARFQIRYALPPSGSLSDEQAVLNLALVVLGDKFTG